MIFISFESAIRVIMRMTRKMKKMKMKTKNDEQEFMRRDLASDSTFIITAATATKVVVHIMTIVAIVTTVVVVVVVIATKDPIATTSEDEQPVAVIVSWSLEGNYSSLDNQLHLVQAFHVSDDYCGASLLII